jgi:hypothetical protein
VAAERPSGPALGAMTTSLLIALGDSPARERQSLLSALGTDRTT